MLVSSSFTWSFQLFAPIMYLNLISPYVHYLLLASDIITFFSFVNGPGSSLIRCTAIIPPTVKFEIQNLMVHLSVSNLPIYREIFNLYYQFLCINLINSWLLSEILSNTAFCFIIWFIMNVYIEYLGEKTFFIFKMLVL